MNAQHNPEDPTTWHFHGARSAKHFPMARRPLPHKQASVSRQHGTGHPGSGGESHAVSPQVEGVAEAPHPGPTPTCSSPPSPNLPLGVPSSTLRSSPALVLGSTKSPRP